MSNFNEGQNGVSLDPKQKTLSEFMVTGDASGRKLGDQVPSHSNDNDDSLSVDTETSFSADTWDSIGLLGTHEILYLHHSDSMLCLKKEETKRNLDLRIDDLENNVCMELDYIVVSFSLRMFLHAFMLHRLTTTIR